MKAWIKRIWSWLTAERSATDELADDEEGRQRREEKERTELERDRWSKPRQTDGYREIRNGW
jgi:hypothetical protein